MIALKPHGAAADKPGMPKIKIGDMVEIRTCLGTLRGRVTREVRSEDRPPGLPDAVEVTFLDDDGQVLDVDAVDPEHLIVIG